MARAYLILLLALAVPSLAMGRPIGGCDGSYITQSNGDIGCADQLDLVLGDFLCITNGAGLVVCAAGGNVVHKGDGSLGESSDWRNSANGGVDFGGTLCELPNSTGPAGADCDAADEAGRVNVDTDGPPGARVDVCTGTTGWEAQGGRLHRLGGGGVDGAFTFNGAADTTCTGGTVSGSSPNKVCTLTANSVLLRNSATDSGTTTLWSCYYEFTTLVLTGGTLACGQSTAYANTGAPVEGAMMVIRVQGSPSITGGTIDMVGKGTAGGAAGASGTSGNRAGGAGGANSFFGQSNGGAAGNNAGVTGLTIPTNPRLGPLRFVMPVGTGGGGGAGSNTAGGAASGYRFDHGYPDEIFGGLGGGGGGCASGVASGTGDVGGRGGGGIVFETAGTWATSSGVVFTVAGSAGGAGGKSGSGGGGGGGIVVFARDLGTDSATYTVSGGAAGARSDATNCALGAAGSSGYARVARAPL